MAIIELRDYQIEAVGKMTNGCILCGGVGSGKSRTSLAYYYVQQGGEIGTEKYVKMVNPKDLYIITTAKKRDSLEWEQEMVPFLLSTTDQTLYENTVVVDSWNNIRKYKDITNAFFIFDEQRVVGKGAWVDAFLKISKNNEWILLSATPGDTWMDYVPVFIANGFYRNRTEFTREHVVYSRFSRNFPKIDRYVNTERLTRLRNRILVDMDFARPTTPHHETIYADYDVSLYRDTMRRRWDPYKNEPIQQASGLCYCLRKIVNTSEERVACLLELLDNHPRAIIFYNFDDELDILLKAHYTDGTEIAQWNGHKHQEIPESEKWVYLVQYTAGCEGWNCIKTDTIVFYSQNYSWKVLEQAAGRIDRMNTPFKDLYYYHLRSHASIDMAIAKAIKEKKIFNESRWVRT